MMDRHRIEGNIPAASDEKNVYVDVYRLLIIGMVISTTLFVISLVLALVHPQYYPLSTDWVRRQYHWKALLQGLRGGEANSFAMIATVVLILTPVSRVMISIGAFLADRDRRFAAVTGIVLLIILLSVLLGLLGLQ